MAINGLFPGSGFPAAAANWMLFILSLIASKVPLDTEVGITHYLSTRRGFVFTGNTGLNFGEDTFSTAGGGVDIGTLEGVLPAAAFFSICIVHQQNGLQVWDCLQQNHPNDSGQVQRESTFLQLPMSVKWFVIRSSSLHNQKVKRQQQGKVGKYVNGQNYTKSTAKASSMKITKHDSRHFTTKSENFWFLIARESCVTGDGHLDGFSGHLKHQNIQGFQKLTSIIHMGNSFIQKPKQKLSNENIKGAFLDCQKLVKALDASPKEPHAFLLDAQFGYNYP
nr:hypothetical protein TorRG33x02_205410 [Ipomoea batatas]